jgi:flagellar basal-body rod protein FlgB
MIGSKNAIIAMAQQMAAHAAARQTTAAENLANANTPGYRARKVAEFAEVFRGEADRTPTVDRQAAVQPNGNSVSLEQQVRHLAEARGEHDLALGLWDRTLNMYRTALGRGR